VQHAPDSKAIAAPFTLLANNVAHQMTLANLTQPQFLALMQQAVFVSGGHNGGHTGVCHNCGKAGHWANCCPKKKKKPHGPKPDAKADKKWCLVPPDSGAPNTKKVGDVTYKWCGKCKRWTTTHNTASHMGKSPSKQSGARLTSQTQAPAHANTFLVPDPSAWNVSFESPSFGSLFHLLLSAFVLMFPSMLISALLTMVIVFDMTTIIFALKSFTASVLSVFLSLLGFVTKNTEFAPGLLWLLLFVFVLMWPPGYWHSTPDH
jgi:hypothetical protein